MNKCYITSDSKKLWLSTVLYHYCGSSQFFWIRRYILRTFKIHIYFSNFLWLSYLNRLCELYLHHHRLQTLPVHPHQNSLVPLDVGCFQGNLLKGIDNKTIKRWIISRLCHLFKICSLLSFTVYKETNWFEIAIKSK